MTEEIQRPHQEVVTAIVQILDEKNIYVPVDHVEMTTAVLCHWLENTRRGHEYMSYLQQLDVVGGMSEKEYKLRDGFGRLTETVKPESIVFLRGCVIDGKSVPVSQVEISDKEILSCDGCGSNTVCLQEINNDDTKGSFCNYCLQSDEQQSIKDLSNYDCDSCTYFHCNWNPANVDTPTYNPPLLA